MKKQRPVTGSAVASWSILDPPRYRERFAFALALSLYFHGLILLLQFGSAGFGLPWAERHVQPTRLTVRLAEAPPPEPPAAEPMRLRAARSLELRPPKAAPSQAQLSLPRRETPAEAPAAKKRAPELKIQAKPPPPVLAQAEPQSETFKVPPPRAAEPEEQRAPESTAKPQIEEPQPPAQAAEEEARRLALAREKELEAKKQADAQRQALELEARKLAEEAARKEAEEVARKDAQEAARAEAEETARKQAEALARERELAAQKEEEAKKLEAARLEEARKQQEAARLQEELKIKEEARRLALEVEALRRAEEAAQQAAARKKELEAQRLAEEAARAREAAERKRAEEQAAAQRERERIAALPGPAPGPAPGAPSGKELAAKALDQLRRPGPARDELLRRPSPPPVIETPRRRLIFGPERDVGVRMYVESWRNKIERNGALNYRRSASWAARDNPVVTVSIRSDGTLEDVHIHRSSGLKEIDDAVRRIARMNAPYSAFPPALARQYDVIEIRRVWLFDQALRILDEVY